MNEVNRPAWSRATGVLRIDNTVDLNDLSRDWAWGGATGRGVRVAIIDSGIEADHPALGNSVAAHAGVDVVLDHEGEPRIVPGAHDDRFGHGTACASIIHRLAPEATIVSVRVLGSGLSGKSSQFLAGLRWAIDQRFDVVNLSLGTTRRDSALAFHDACDAAYFAGCFLVTAANNLQRESYPSLFAAVASVACSTSKDPLRFHWNPDPPTEFLAPGIDVEVAWRGGSTATVTGNSYAAPHIAGLAALIRSKHSNLRPYQLKTVLWATATNVIEATERGPGAVVTRPVPAGRVTRALASLPNARSTVFLGPARTHG